MKKELSLRGICFISEVQTPVNYKGMELGRDLKCDLFVENSLSVELKSVDTIHPIHEAQLLTYMKLLNRPLGLLINFNCVSIFKQGQRTLVNEMYRRLSS
jgi:GxxExxY protein